MSDRLPAGFRLGHRSDPRGVTGCSVILCPPGTVGGCDIRGGSPGSRELALLSPDRSNQEVHAVLLTGGSAYGLAAADGVMRWLEERGIGYRTPWALVPIVPAAVIFDLNVGSPSARPMPLAGYEACQSATEVVGARGAVGAGTGATVGKWAGPETRMRGGLGVASLEHEGLVVTAVAAVNAVGDILERDGTILAGARTPGGRWLAEEDPRRALRLVRPQPLQTNTTLVAILTNARLSKVDAGRLAQRGHDGMARAVKPAHTSFDGDLVFGLAAGQADAALDVVAEMGADAAAEAIRDAVR